GQTLGETLAEGAPQLLWRQFRGRGGIGGEAPQSRHDQREFGGSVPQPLAERLRARGLCQRCLENFRKREIRTGLLPLIAVAQQGEKALVRGVGGDLGGQAGLPDPHAAAQQYDGSLAVARAVDEPTQQRRLLLSVDKGCLRERRQPGPGLHARGRTGVSWGCLVAE